GSQSFKVARIIIAYKAICRSPFAQVISQGGYSCFNDLIGYQDTAVTDQGADQCAFAAGGCTEIKHFQAAREVCRMLQNLFEEHGRSFLHVIAAGMEQGIRSK